MLKQQKNCIETSIISSLPIKTDKQMALAGNDLISITFGLYQGYFEKKCPSTSNYASLGFVPPALF